jgi:hypothetical protein
MHLSSCEMSIYYLSPTYLHEFTHLLFTYKYLHINYQPLPTYDLHMVLTSNLPTYILACNLPISYLIINSHMYILPTYIIFIFLSIYYQPTHL